MSKDNPKKDPAVAVDSAAGSADSLEFEHREPSIADTPPVEAEVTLGRARGAQEEIEALQAANDELTEQLDEQVEDRRRIQLLEEQLAETMEYIAKLRSQGLAGDDIGAAASEEIRVRKRREFYQKVRDENGGVVVIQLHTTEDARKNWPVPVGINGNTLLMPRGVPLNVPIDYVEVLENARVRGVARVVDEAGNPKVQPYDYLSYPFTIISAGLAESAKTLPLHRFAA